MTPFFVLKRLTQRRGLRLRGLDLQLQGVDLIEMHLQLFKLYDFISICRNARVSCVSPCSRRPCQRAQGGDFKFERLHSFECLCVLLGDLRALILSPAARLCCSRAARIELALGIKRHVSAEQPSCF
jgi:hypothetical protein